MEHPNSYRLLHKSKIPAYKLTNPMHCRCTFHLSDSFVSHEIELIKFPCKIECLLDSGSCESDYGNAYQQSACKQWRLTPKDRERLYVNDNNSHEVIWSLQRISETIRSIPYTTDIKIGMGNSVTCSMREPICRGNWGRMIDGSLQSHEQTKRTCE